MSNSILEQIIGETQTLIVSLNLSGIGSNVQATKLPAVEEDIDILPLISLSTGDRPEEVKWSDFEGGKFVWYSLEVVAITKGKKLLGVTGNADPNDDLFRQIDWRQQIRNLLFNPKVYSSSSKLLRTYIMPGPPVDRKKVNENYDYSSLLIRFKTQE